MSSRILGTNKPILAGLFKREGRHAARPAAQAKTEESIEHGGAALSAVAPVVAVLGAKGGVGASTVAFNLAAAAAASGVSTTLVDAKLQMPDIANLIGSEASHSLLELLSRGSGVDRLLYQACRMEPLADCPQFGVLLPPSDGEAFLKSNLSELSQCLGQLKQFDSLFVVDVPTHLDRHLVTLLDQATTVVLVFEATISGVAACKRWLQVLQELDYDSDRIMLVVNRAGSKYKLVEEQLGPCFGGRACWKIPNASSLTWDSTSNGTPVVLSHAGSPYGRAIGKLWADLQMLLKAR